MKKIKFFHHDGTLKRKWVTQEQEDKYSETKFGDFTKELYPFGFQSVFIFVDHCDFDTPEKVKAVFYGTSDEKSKDFGRKGILGCGLTATKTVFVDGKGTENIGMENDSYRKLVYRLYKDGIEIVPHSLTPRDSLKNGSLRLKSYLNDMANFKPKTWTDHGYGLHNIVHFGCCKKSPYYILAELYKRGYRYFWSRIDYSLNAPDGNLNVFNSSGRAGIDYFKKVLGLIKAKSQLKKIIFVFFWDFLGCLIGWEAKDDLVYAFDTTHYYIRKLIGKNIPPPHAFSRRAIIRTLLRTINPFFYIQMLHNFFFLNKTTGLTQGFFSVNIDEKNDIFFFDSLWVNDCDEVYSPKNIDRLVKERGLHLGHNYFSVEEKHYLNLAFKIVDNNYAISEKFQGNLRYLAKCQREKKIWVTTVGNFGDYCSKLRHLKIKNISENKLFIKNLGDGRIDGLTFELINQKDFEKTNLKFSKKKNWDFTVSNSIIRFWFSLDSKEELFLMLKK